MLIQLTEHELTTSLTSYVAHCCDNRNLTMYFSYHLYVGYEIIGTCTYSTCTIFVCIAEFLMIKYDSNPCQLSCY